MKKVIVLIVFTTLTMLLSGQAFAAVAACEWGFETSPAPLPAGTYRAISATVGEYFYYIGGNVGSTAYDDVYRYSPIDDTWETLTSIPTAVSGACGDAIDGKIYVVGGSFTNNVQIYDTETDTWSAGSTYPYSLTGCMAAAVDGVLYVAGGRLSNDTVLAAGYSYDPLLDQWDAIADMPAAKYYGHGVAYWDLFWAVGGWNIESNYAYDPDTNTWSTETDVPVDANDVNLIAPDYEGSTYFWTFGTGDQWVPDGTIRGYDTDLSAWYVAGLFGTLPTAKFASGADNFHDAVFIIAGGAVTNSTTTDEVAVFRYCLPYLSPVSNPQEVVNYQETEITLTGLNFDDETGSEYYMAYAPKESSIKAPAIQFTELTVVDSNTILATVPSSLSIGDYKIFAKNAMSIYLDVSAFVSEGELTVTAPEPVVNSVLPTVVEVGDQVTLTIAGNHFFGTPDVVLSGPTKGEIFGTNVTVVDVDEITADFDLDGATAGLYNLVVGTDNGYGTLTEGVNVTEATDDDTTDDDTVDDDTSDDDTSDDDTSDDDTSDDDTSDDDTSDDDTADDDFIPPSDDDDSADDDDMVGGGDDDDDDGCGC